MLHHFATTNTALQVKMIHRLVDGGTRWLRLGWALGQPWTGVGNCPILAILDITL